MTRESRVLVVAIRDAADKYLAASNHAEKYVYGQGFAAAMIAYHEYALAYEKGKVRSA